MAALAKDRRDGARRSGMELRWYFVVLVTAAIAISYFDRQTLPVAISAIQRNIPISDQRFSYLQTSFLLSYAALYVIGGRLLDRLGTRRGFMLIMLWWSIACALHGLATGFLLLLVARFLLGMGEGGAFPAAARVVSEWIAPEERSTAMGIINAGTAIGSVLAPPLIGFILLTIGWRAPYLRSPAHSAPHGFSGGCCPIAAMQSPSPPTRSTRACSPSSLHCARLSASAASSRLSSQSS